MAYIAHWRRSSSLQEQNLNAGSPYTNLRWHLLNPHCHIQKGERKNRPVWYPSQSVAVSFNGTLWHIKTGSRVRLNTDYQDELWVLAASSRKALAYWPQSFPISSIPLSLMVFLRGIAMLQPHDRHRSLRRIDFESCHALSYISFSAILFPAVRVSRPLNS